MKRVLLVVKTEVLEQRRQPAMLLVMASNYLLWNLIFIAVLVFLNSTRENPQVMSMLDKRVLEMGICNGESALNTLVKLTSMNFGAILFTTMSVFSAYMSAYSVLNDRLSNTMPFLMLAPLSRYQLLLGKVLGATAIPFLMHLGFVGFTTFAVRSLEIMAPFSESWGGSPAWWVAFLVGAPAASFFVGSLGTVISGLSKDVRTSMQSTSFAIGLLSLAFSYLLIEQIKSGVAVQIMVALGGFLGGFLILLVGSKVISRDIA